MESRLRACLAILLAAVCAGCGATAPPPTARVASTEAAIRGARELGAQSVPTASLHLRLSEEQAKKANEAMASEENARADILLQRAQADAELAIALTREVTAKAERKSSTERLQQAQGAK